MGCALWVGCHSERIGKLLQMGLGLRVLLGGHGYLLVKGGGSHHNQVQVFQPFALRHVEACPIHVAINLLIVGSDAYKPIAQILTPQLQAKALGTQVHLVVEPDGIKSIFLGVVFGEEPSRAVGQFCIKGAGILAGLLAGMLEVEVHQVLITPEHLVAESLLRESIHALVGHHRVFTQLALTVELSY